MKTRLADAKKIQMKYKRLMAGFSCPTGYLVMAAGKPEVPNLLDVTYVRGTRWDR